MLSEEQLSSLRERVCTYLHETLGVEPAIQQWAGQRGLPYFLQDAFEFYELKIRDLSILLAASRRAETPRLATIRGHVEKLRSLADLPVAYVADALASYERKRLIEQKVPFIVPGNQLYLPDLGIDLREYFRQKAQAPRQALSPATQAMLISAMLDKSTQTVWYPAETAAKLTYTPMTLSRAINELTTAGIAAVERKAQGSWLHMERPPAETWKLVKPLLRSPVRRSEWTARSPKLHPEERLPLAGLSALSRYSGLTEPALPVYALNMRSWQVLTQQGLPTVPEPLPGTFELQVWSYAPIPMPDSTAVDPLSLTLSLQNESDERVQGALEELQEYFPW